MDLYLSDESRRVGTAQEICFPETTQDVSLLLRENSNVPVTLQGGRTGVTAGAVPDGGLVLNLSRMSRIMELPDDPSADAGGILGDGSSDPLRAVVQPGLLLCRLQEELTKKHVFFPPDPTETTASLGGMVSCNSSGARSYRYGATRDHILGLRMVLAGGDTLTIRRGQCMAKAGAFAVTTDSGRTIRGTLPSIRMPQVKKHTAGYYIRPEMDLLDLFVGSEGTLGIVTEIECHLLPEPKELWGCIAFFEREESALRYVHLLRGDAVVDGTTVGGAAVSNGAMSLQPEAIEFFGCDTLNMLRHAQAAGQVLTDMAVIPDGCAVYTEFSSDTRDGLTALCSSLGENITLAGGDPACSWFAFRGPDMLRLKAFRHAAPTCVNEQISLIQQDVPDITKLGTDMSVPDDCLDQVFAMYRKDLAKEGFETSLFGHIGNNHLHCNIIPHSKEEYLRGKALYTRWAEAIVAMGGSVSAEHGIGKLKPWLLQKQYTPVELQSMVELKHLFDPSMRLNPGNVFGR